MSIDPHKIRWEIVNSDGSKSATLVGNRNPGVQFTYAFFVPAGMWDQPHSHPADSHLHVAAGKLHLGYGDTFDLALIDEFPAGSFLFVPAGRVHFDGSNEETILIGTAVGPWATEYVAGSH